MRSIHDYLQSIGYITDKLPLNFIIGKEYRFPSLGKSNKNTSASIKLTHDGIYVWNDHANDASGSFNPNSANKQNKPDPEVAAKRAKRLEVEKKAQIEKRAKAKNEAQQIWERAQPCDSHPYMATAGVKIAGQVRTLPCIKTLGGQTFKNPLIVPRYDAKTGELVNLEFIAPDGEKRPLTGAKKQGTYFEINGQEPAYFVEGYKTGCAVHNATGRRVICSFDVGNLKEIFPVLAKPENAIIADNDNKPKKGDVIVPRRMLKAKGAGHKAAHELKAKFWLIPELGADAADIPADRLSALLSQHPTSDLPVFDAWKDLTPVFDETPAKDLIEKLKTEKDPLKCAGIALNYGFKCLQSIPFKKNIIELRAEIEVASVGRMHPITIDNITARLDWLISKDSAQALNIVRIDDCKQHNKIMVNSLHDAPIYYKGVWLVTAPTGSMKTQLIGRSFREYCRTNNFEFLSLAHLRSLIDEMATKLDTAHYTIEKETILKGEKDQRSAAIASLESLSICLPSLAHQYFSPFISRAKYIFIDEISQVLQAFNTDHIFEKTKTDLVFNLLRELIKNADCLICADANINQETLEFIEQCRPDEKFNIVEMPPVNEGKTANIYGSEAELLKQIVYDLMVNNSNVWITCDSKNKALAIEKALSQYDELSIITLVANSHNNRAEKEFLLNPHEESKKYRVVISSPVISSGISIEHDHFDYVAGFFSGYSVQPADAYQMIGRVRQCKNFHLYVNQHNTAVINAERVIEAQKQAATLEGTQGKVSEFTKYRAKLNESRNRIKSSFANNLIYILNAKKFNIKRMDEQSAINEEEQLKEISDELKQEERDQIKAAVKITDEQADRLDKKDVLGESEVYSLKAFKHRKALGYGWEHELTDQDLDISPSMVRRYSAFIGKHSRANDKANDLASRKYSEALAKAYRIAFADIDLKAGAIYFENCATAILERVFKHRYLLAVLGAIPPRYGRENFKPHSYAAKDLKAIFEHIGIKTSRTRFSAKMGQMGLFLYIEYASSVPNERQEKCYYIDSEQLELMQHYSDLKASQYIQITINEDVIYWSDVRLDLWQKVGQITEQQAIDRLIAAMDGRLKTKESNKTAWWAKNVLKPTFRTNIAT